VNALGAVDRWPVPSAAVAVAGPDGLIDRHGSFYVNGPWASVTKLLTAYVVLIACEQGITDLDERAGPPGSTVRHLLAHASGLPFEGQAPIAPPNRRRIYSNSGFDLLGAHISHRSGTPFTEFMQIQLLDPLGMEGELRGRASEGFQGTVLGMARLGTEFLAPTLLSREMMNLAATPAFPNLAGTLPTIGRFDPLHWGLGFELKDRKVPHWTGTANSEATFGHFGGSGSFLWVDPDASLSLGCMTGLEFGPWALELWPHLSDQVLAEAAAGSDHRPER
jgi:CubicO group peptidase (beta-lactamase class C family)